MCRLFVFVVKNVFLLLVLILVFFLLIEIVVGRSGIFSGQSPVLLRKILEGDVSVFEVYRKGAFDVQDCRGVEICVDFPFKRYGYAFPGNGVVEIDEFRYPLFYDIFDEYGIDGTVSDIHECISGHHLPVGREGLEQYGLVKRELQIFAEVLVERVQGVVRMYGIYSVEPFDSF